MIKKLFNRFSEKFLSRWAVLAIDVALCTVLFYMAVLIRYNFDLTAIDVRHLPQHSFVVALAYLIAFLWGGSYRGIIRQTGLTDAFLLFKSTFAGFLILFLLSLFRIDAIPSDSLRISRSVLVIHYLLTLTVLLGFRFLVKRIFQSAAKRHNNSRRTRILIFGSGAAGEITKQSLQREITIHYDIVGYIDDNPTKQGKIQDGVHVYSREKALTQDFVDDNRIHQLIIAVQNLPIDIRRELIEQSMSLGIKVKVVPPTSKWIQGELTIKQIKDVRIEDLLERESIDLGNVNISREIQDKVILVTGAAGSIGSEILRQVLHYSPKKIIALDQAESSLYEIEMELLHNRPNHHQNTDFIVADITHQERISRIFESIKPDIIFHAAAYKHVPLMELHPYEAISVNIFGTKNITDLATLHNVEKMVFVSTDKAVNPTNVMGASKRIAEMYVQSLSENKSNTQFITTRFGNVLGSNGSVIPLFRKQIEQGGPITITHPDITRYFMTIPEACNLVLEAGAMGQGGEIFVFDMGESVKILDLAKNMVRLSGLVVGRDIEFKFTGLRPGEKLYEELLANSEDTLPTHHEKIMIAKTRPVDAEHLNYLLEALKTALISQSPNDMVRLMKDIAKEFKSNNSEFSKLDKS